MPNLTENPDWTPNVYELALDDPVEGGPNGVDNQPHRELANRTLFLKQIALQQWANDPATTEDLDYGFFGGMAVSAAGAAVMIAAGVVALANNATNYLERSYAGVVSANQVGFTKTAIPLAKVTTVGGQISAIEDWRPVHGPFPYFPVVAGEVSVADVRYGYGDIRRFGAPADGVADARAAIAAADDAVQAGAGGEVVFADGGVYAIAADLTIDSPVRMQAGPTLKPANGVVVTFEGVFTATRSKHFDISAGGEIRFTAAAVDAAWVEWFGAVANDPAVNSRDAFEAAFFSVDNSTVLEPVLGPAGIVRGGYGEFFLEAGAGGTIVVPPNAWFEGVAHLRRGGTRINHVDGALLFKFSGSSEGGGGFNGGGMRNVTFTGGFVGATAVDARRAWTTWENVGFELYEGECGLDFDEDPAGVNQGNPFSTTITGFWARCATAGGEALLNYGIRARRNFNAATIRTGMLVGCKVAGVAVEGGANVTIETTCENCFDGADGAVGILIGAGAGMPTDVKIRLYGEANDGAHVKIVKADGCEVTVYADGATGASAHDTQYGISIIDASGTGANVKGVRIIGGRMGRQALADVYIEGTRNVVIDSEGLHSTTPIALGAGGGYERRMPLIATIADGVAYELSEARLGDRIGEITITEGNTRLYKGLHRNGGGTGFTEMLDANLNFTDTKNTAGATNIYRDVDGKDYLQNMTGVERTYCITYRRHRAA